MTMSNDPAITGNSMVLPAFDQGRLIVSGGTGVVARFAGIIAVYALDDAMPGQDELLARFIEICDQTSRAGARSPGRRLARQLSVWLGGMDELPCIATVAATDDGLAVFLTRQASLRIEGSDAGLSGGESAAWLDRIIGWPGAPFTLSVAASAPPASKVLNLQLGVVAGDTATMDSAEPPGRPFEQAAPPLANDESMLPAAVPATAQPESAVVPVPEPPPALMPDLAPPEPLRPPMRSTQIAGAPSVEPPRPPLPIPGRSDLAAVSEDPAAVDSAPQVQGFLCSRGHLNDPRALFCALCGIRMAERTGVLTIGRRPPLGLLVFDDGSTYTVDSGYLLGRDPDSDDRVRQGGLRPLPIVDPRGAISRRHVLIELDGWIVQISDIGSANGTFVAERGAASWSALVPNVPVPLQTSMRVRLGSRSFVFESPHGAT